MDKAEWLHTMVEGTDEGLVVVGPGGDVVGINRAAARLTALDREAVVGRPLTALRAESDFPWSVAATAAERRQIVSAVHTQDDGATLLIAAKPLFAADGGLRSVVVTIRDVREVGHAVASLGDGRSRSERDRAELGTAEMGERHAGVVIGDGGAMRAARDLALKYAAFDAPVLLRGETGTGKGVFSRMIHGASARARGPFIELNCGAIPEGVIEAELFGYVRGAFTGADARGKPGLLELAHGGTVLLDEIGDLPLGLQVKLLRFLDDGRIWPVGAVRFRRPDVRVLAATHRDLEALIARGAFRRDLFYRLNVLTLRLPPLRERREDIPQLVAMMLDHLGPRLRRRVAMAPAALAVIARYDFPGNVRELWNVVERLAITSEQDVLEVADLPSEVAPAPPAASSPAPVEESRTLRRALEEVEAAILREALERYGSQTLAAAHLGVSQATVARRARRYGLPR